MNNDKQSVWKDPVLRRMLVIGVAMVAVGLTLIAAVLLSIQDMTTGTPVARLTSIPTNTPIPPSPPAIIPTVAVAPTDTPVAPLPVTPTPTQTWTPTGTATPTPTPTWIPWQPTATPWYWPQPWPTGSTWCPQPPYGWVQYIVRPDETLNSIAWRFGISLYELTRVNCLSYPVVYPGQRIYVPPAPVTPIPTPPCSPPPYDWRLYTVKWGDTLYSLSWRFQVAIPYIVQANCLRSYTLSVGQQLYLPPLPTPTWTPWPPTPTWTPIILTSTPTPIIVTPTGTQMPTPTFTPLPTGTEPPTPTLTPLPTGTEPPTPTLTPLPTNTLEPVPTSTLPPTSTQPPPTNTLEPAPTSTPPSPQPSLPTATTIPTLGS